MYRVSEISNRDSLFLFLIHTISEEFRDHAILKGGMVLRLLGSKRETLDLDYTLIPYSSKNEVLGDIENLFSKIEGLRYEIKVHSKMIRVIVYANKINAQVEINVANSIKSDIISTASLKTSKSTLTPRIIKIMSLDIALSHKIAAWNERRLLRDLYDIYYLFEVQNILPDESTLKERLDNFSSRLPTHKKIKKVTKEELFRDLKEQSDILNQKDIEKELEGILEDIELVGLAMRIKDSIHRLILRCG